MGKHLARIIVLFSVFAIISAITVFGFSSYSYAASSADVDNLQDEIAHRKAEIDLINGKMDEYRAKVNEYSRKTASLLNDMAFIENQITLAELDVQATQAEMETKQLEIEVLEQQIQMESERLLSQKDMLKEMIFALHRRDNIGFVEVLFGANDFGTLFEELDQLESVNQNLNSAMDVTKTTRDNLEESHDQQESGLNELVELQGELKMQVTQLESKRSSKDILVFETQSSEAQYRVLMSELRQEQQYITTQISKLQSDLQKQIVAGNNDAGSSDGTVLASPLDSYVQTATFHDTTYPFRHLWEHSGYDMAAPSGTPVKAAGSGVVAWTRTGRNYGNYIMVIHEGGLATLYAHLSRFNTTAESYVSRGQVIGYVGSTGFSTGPHLHFEVRLNGIPVNPQAYISGL